MEPVNDDGENRARRPDFTSVENQKLVDAVIRWREGIPEEYKQNVNSRSIRNHDWKKIASDAGLLASRGATAVMERWKLMYKHNIVVEYVDECYREMFAPVLDQSVPSVRRSSYGLNRSQQPSRRSTNAPVSSVLHITSDPGYTLADMGIEKVMQDFLQVLPHISHMCTINSLELDKYLHASDRLGGKMQWTLAIGNLLANDSTRTDQRLLEYCDAADEEVIDREMKELKRLFGESFRPLSTADKRNETNLCHKSGVAPFQANSSNEFESMDEGIGSTIGPDESPQASQNSRSAGRVDENLASLIQEQLDYEDEMEADNAGECDSNTDGMNVDYFIREKLKPSKWLCKDNDWETVPTGYKAYNQRQLTQNEWLRVMKAAGLKNKCFALMTLEEWEKIRNEKLKTVKTAEEIRLEFFCRVLPNLDEFTYLPFRPVVCFTEYNMLSKITIFHSLTIVSVSQLKHCIQELVKSNVLLTNNLTKDEWYSEFVQDIESSSEKDQDVSFHTTEKDFLDVKKALLKDIVKCGVQKICIYY